MSLIPKNMKIKINEDQELDMIQENEDDLMEITPNVMEFVQVR